MNSESDLREERLSRDTRALQVNFKFEIRIRVSDWSKCVV